MLVFCWCILWNRVDGFVWHQCSCVCIFEFASSETILSTMIASYFYLTLFIASASGVTASIHVSRAAVAFGLWRIFMFEFCLVSVCKITPIIIVIVSKTLHFMQTKTSTFDIIFVCRLDTEYMHICTVHTKWNSRTNGFLNGWWHIKQHSNHTPCSNRQWGRLANVATNIIYILYTC